MRRVWVAHRARAEGEGEGEWMEGGEGDGQGGEERGREGEKQREREIHINARNGPKSQESQSSSPECTVAGGGPDEVGGHRVPVRVVSTEAVAADRSFGHHIGS